MRLKQRSKSACKRSEFLITLLDGEKLSQCHSRVLHDLRSELLVQFKILSEKPSAERQCAKISD